jgi:hypothetical protein
MIDPQSVILEIRDLTPKIVTRLNQ